MRTKPAEPVSEEQGSSAGPLLVVSVHLVLLSSDGSTASSPLNLGSVVCLLLCLDPSSDPGQTLVPRRLHGGSEPAQTVSPHHRVDSWDELFGLQCILGKHLHFGTMR
uniref:Uncharacterized protein n=1 Tax=Nothobranchius furzeri TaxID=105023 RepID=A0A1A8UAK6_NOTFU